MATAHLQSCGGTALEGGVFKDPPPGNCRYRSHTHLAAVLAGTILPDALVSGYLLCLSPDAAAPKAWEHQIRTLLGLSSQGTAGKIWSWRQRQVLSNTLVLLLQDTSHSLRGNRGASSCPLASPCPPCDIYSIFSNQNTFSSKQQIWK